MRVKKKQRLLAAVASLVQPDEQIELVVHEAAVGKVSMKRQLGVAVATAIASLGP